jgi:hypothetical protein
MKGHKLTQYVIYQRVVIDGYVLCRVFNHE